MTTIQIAQDAIDHKDEISRAVLKRRLRAIIYCRVSSDKQEQDGDSLEFQEEKCRRYCDLHDMEIATILKEVKSGFIHYSLREKLAIARQMVRDKVADVIIVWDLRRFSRNFVHSAMIFQEIEEAGGAVISVSENIDNSLTGQLIRAVLSWSAESERHKYVEYANRRWQSRVELGLPVGTGSAPYGWQWGDKEKTFYVSDPEQARVRFAIFHMYVELEMSLRAVADKLTADGIPSPRGPQKRKKRSDFPGVARRQQEEETEEKWPGVWNRSTVRRILRDPANIGLLAICQTKVVYTPDGKRRNLAHPECREIIGGIPPLIPEELYGRAQEKLATNQQNLSKLSKTPEAFLLQGHIYCGCCGNKMMPRSFYGKKNPPLYLCKPRSNKHADCRNQQSIRNSPLNEIVWADSCVLFERLERVKERIEQRMAEEVKALLEQSTGNEQMLKVEAELEQAKVEQQKHPKDSYVYGAIARDIAQKEEELARYRQEMGMVGSLEQTLAIFQERLLWFLDFLTQMRGKYEQATFQEKRNALDILGVKVVVHDPVYIEKEEEQQEEEDPDVWYTIKDAAAIWGVDPWTVHGHIRAGRLSVWQRSERKRFVKASELRALMRAGWGYHNDERGVRSRIDIYYEPRFRRVLWDAMTHKTGVTNYRLS